MKRDKGIARGTKRIWPEGAVALLVLTAAALLLACAKTNGPAAASQSGREAEKPAVPQTGRSFRELGAPTAPIVCELYSDYECPACARAFRQVLPRLAAEFVMAGKVRLVHRDFPLPQHQYARMAASYANAAGRVGYYDPVVRRLFQTQSEWSGSGAVDEEVARVIPAKTMEEVERIVAEDSQLEDELDADIAKARQDGVRQMPSIVVISKGQRRLIGPVPSFELLKKYLDDELAFSSHR